MRFDNESLLLRCYLISRAVLESRFLGIIVLECVVLNSIVLDSIVLERHVRLVCERLFRFANGRIAAALTDLRGISII